MTELPGHRFPAQGRGSDGAHSPKECTTLSYRVELFMSLTLFDLSLLIYLYAVRDSQQYNASI